MKVQEQLKKIAVTSLTLLTLFFTQTLTASGMGTAQDYVIDRLEFNDAAMVDVVRVLSELSGVNIVTTVEASDKKVTVFLRDISIPDAIDTLCKISGLWYRKDSKTGVYRIMETDAYQKDLVVFKNDLLRVFPMRHYNVVSAARAIQNLFGNRVRMQLDPQADETGLGRNSGLGFGGGGGGGGGGFGGGGFGGGGFGGGGFGGGGFNNSGNGFNNGGNSFNGGGGNFFGGGGFQGGGQNGSGRSLLSGIELTADQIAAMEGAFSEGPLPEIGTTDLVALTAQEPMINVTTSRLHNLVMVRTSDEDAMGEIEQLLGELDRVAPQVLLEMKILDLNLGDSFRSVFDIDYTSDKTASGPLSSAPRNPLIPGGVIPPAVALGVGNFPLEGGTLLFQWMNDNIRMRLQLLELENRVNTLASPVLLASNNTPARLFIGEEVVLTTGVSTTTQIANDSPAVNLTTPTTEVVSIGNTLTLVPRVNSDGSVTINMVTDVSSLKPNGSTIPVTGANGTVTEFPVDAVNESTLEGSFLAQDGLTVAVGGLIRKTESMTSQKVPWLGDIPYLGFFFKQEELGETSSELVVLITPHVFLGGEEAEVRSLDVMNRLSSEAVEDRFASDPKRLIMESLKGGEPQDPTPLRALEHE